MSAELRELSARLSAEAIRYGEKAKREGGIDGLMDAAVGEALMRVSRMVRDTAIATETRRAETTQVGSVEDEGAVRSNRPTSSGDNQ